MTELDPKTLKRSLVVYLLVAFGLAWPAQAAATPLLASLKDTPAALGIAGLVVAALMMWPPAIGAIVARKLVERRGFADAGLRWPKPAVRPLGVAYLGTIALVLLAILVSLPAYPPDLELKTLKDLIAKSGQQVPLSAGALLAIQLASALTFAPIFNCLFAFGEELGWRGHLLPRLSQWLGPWPGALLHGAIWGVWHAPIIVLGGHNYPAHPYAGAVHFIGFCTLAGVLLAWLQRWSNSVLVPTFAHGLLNALGGFPMIVLVGVDPLWGGTVYSTAGLGVMLVAVALASRTPSFRAAFAQADAARATTTTYPSGSAQ